MSPSQVSLMKKAIFMTRNAQTGDEELVEVGEINGVDPRTARTLVRAGLLVEDMPRSASRFTATHVRLPRAGEIANPW